jgi:hypothetical protein
MKEECSASTGVARLKPSTGQSMHEISLHLCSREMISTNVKELKRLILFIRVVYPNTITSVDPLILYLTKKMLLECTHDSCGS